jgi:hypothetical protein
MLLNTPLSDTIGPTMLTVPTPPPVVSANGLDVAIAAKAEPAVSLTGDGAQAIPVRLRSSPRHSAPIPRARDLITASNLSSIYPGIFPILPDSSQNGAPHAGPKLNARGANDALTSATLPCRVDRASNISSPPSHIQLHWNRVGCLNRPAPEFLL